MRVLIFLVTIFSFSIAHADSYQTFSDNGKMGIKNEKGQVVVPPSFEALGWSDGSFSVIGNVTGYRINNQWGILSLKNEFITKSDYESLVYAGADNIVAQKRINPAYTKTGCINLQGEVKIPFQYDGITVYGLRAVVFNLVSANYVYGLIDLESHILIPVQYKNIYPLGTLRYAVEDKTGKIALHGEDGKPITDFQIDSISQFHDSKAIVYENLNQGLIDRDGLIKLKSIYHSIQIMGENKVKVQPHHEWLFITSKNEIVNRLSADELIPVSEELFIIKTSGKYGLIDNDLKLVCPVRYDVLSPIGDNLFLTRQSGKMGVIKSDNTTVVPFMYDSLYAHENALRAYRKIEGWSIIDRNNITLTKKNYDWIGVQNKNHYPVMNNHYWGLLSASGEEIVHCVFDSLVEVTNDLVVVKFKNQYGIINNREDWLVAPQTQPINLINHQLYSQKQSPNIFLKNFAGEIVYFTDNRLEFKEDFFYEYLTDGTEKTIDYQGRIVNRISPPAISNVEHIFQSSEGLRGIKRDGKFGFIDERGRLRIVNRYDDIGEFHEGLAPFKLIGKWGFINSSDQVVINPNYEKVNDFKDGLCVVSRNGKSGVINKTGNPILTFQYDSIHALPNKKFILFAGGLRGLADEKGSILIDPRFYYLSELESGLVLVGIAGKFGVLTSTGLDVIPIIYENLSFDKKHNQFLALKKSEWKEIEIN